MSPECPARSVLEQAAICLGLLFRFHGQAADPGRVLAHVAFDQPNATAQLARWLARDGHKAKVIDATPEALAAKPLPALAERVGGGYFVIARWADGKALIHDPLQSGVRAVDAATLADVWTGRLLLFQPRDGGAGRVAGRFDLTWFLPAIVRYRRLLGEVLAASFFVQVMALVTPVFFQVVIDKVLPHRGLTSLDILVLGMALVALFEVLLGALRTYVLAHTTSRMDVELGASLFHHMMALPMSFFGARPAGTVVARMRELETVRTFLTGSALSVAVDAVFAVVFFVAMYVYSPTLTWVVLATVPLYVALSLVVTPILRRRIDDRFRAAAENQAFLVECVSAAETVKAMAVEPQMQRRWEHLLARQVGSSFAVSALANFGSQAVQFVSKATTVATLWWGARLVIDGDLTIGELVAFNMRPPGFRRPSFAWASCGRTSSR